MLSSKYHIGSLVAIFLALGIGILIGGSLGQQWMFQTEQHTLSVLMEKYEDQLEENQRLNKDYNSVELMKRSVVPMFADKRILWIRPHTLQNELLAEMMVSAGADWVETEAGHQLAEEVKTDMVIISDPEQIETILQSQGRQLKENLDEHTEKASSAPEDLDHRSGME